MSVNFKIAVIFAAILAVYGLLNMYIGWHGALLLDHAGLSSWKPWFWTVFAIVALGYVLGRIRPIPGPLRRLLKVAGAVYFAVFEFSLLMLPAADVAGLLLAMAGVKPDAYVPALGGAVIAALLVLLLVGSYNAWSPAVRRYRLDIGKKAGNHRELKIAMVSDLHLGNIVGRRHLRRLAKLVEEMRPDLIVFAGDILDDDIEPFIRNNMSEELARLKAPLGIYAVLGNHEYYGGHIAEHARQMDRLGIRLLRDETVLVDDAFYIVGRKDRTAESADPDKRKDFKTLLSGLDLSRPVIVLDHQPNQFGIAAAAGVDVLLCGHTHRGQFAPNHWITRRVFELDWGYMRKGNMHVVVSSGFGTWGPPIRLASRCELVELTLNFA